MLEVEADLELVHGWMQEPHVTPWWGLEGGPERVRAHLLEQDRLPYRDPWIVSDAGRPFAYVETYRVPDDPLAAHYDAQPGDRGFALLVGPPELLGSGLAQALVRHLVVRLLDQFGITRVVCLTDVRNARMLALCRSLGAVELATLELPGGRALLVGWPSTMGV